MQSPAFETITSRDNERVKATAKLAASGSARAEAGLFFAEGVRLCLDLAAALKPKEAYFTEDVLQKHPEAACIAEQGFLIKPHVAEKLSRTKTPQGLFCLFPLPATGWQGVQPEKGVLVCEALQDPANVGAVLRSAAAFGFGGVVLCEGCADPFAPKALRASVGAAARLPLVLGGTAAAAAAQLKVSGARVYAAALRDAKPLNEVQVQRPFALLIGSEGPGLTPAALDAADEAVYIPMQRGVESLNAGVAAGVLMYHFSTGGA